MKGDSDFATCLGLGTVILLHVLGQGQCFCYMAKGRDSDFATWDSVFAT